MARTLKLALVVMLVLAPLRAFATASVGCCAMSQETSVVAAARSGHDAMHEHPGAPHDAGAHEDCATCVDSCASAALVCAAPFSLPAAFDDRGMVFVRPVVASFVPEHLDRSPLVG